MTSGPHLSAAPPAGIRGAASSPVSHSRGGHVPVLCGAVLEHLSPALGRGKDAIVVDGTFGGGGYAAAFLERTAARVIGIDRDPDAVARGRDLACRHAGRFTMIEGRFGEMDRLVAAAGFKDVDGVALDLGLSSFQLDEAARGFSFLADGPLDMRMERAGMSAADVVNTFEEGDLAFIIAEYGEERFARRIARAIMRHRRDKPLARTLELARLITASVPKTGDAIDPATRTFQALRIYVNRELDELEAGLGAAERLLTAGGRLAVVAFHSLEDRIVKSFLRDRSAVRGTSSRHLPAAETARPATFRIVTAKPVTPNAAEIDANPRARSAKLRVGERTDAPARAEGRS